MIDKITTYDALEAMYRNDIITNQWFLDSEFEITQYNKNKSQENYIISENGEINKEHVEILKNLDNISIENLIQNGLNIWLIPNEYKTLDIKEYIIALGDKTNESRIIEELELFEKNNMLEVLKFLVYFVETMRKNNLVWGIGRGSSVASYVLFLIGVHKVDSIKYGLDIHEFLK